MRALSIVLSISIFVVGCSSSGASVTGTTSTGHRRQRHVHDDVHVRLQRRDGRLERHDGQRGLRVRRRRAGDHLHDGRGPDLPHARRGADELHHDPPREHGRWLRAARDRRPERGLAPHDRLQVVGHDRVPDADQVLRPRRHPRGQHPFFIAQQAHAELDWPSDENGNPVGFEIGPNQMVHIEFHTINTTQAPLMVTGKALIDTIPLSTPNVVPSDMAFWGTKNIDIPPNGSFDTGVHYQYGHPGHEVVRGHHAPAPPRHADAGLVRVERDRHDQPHRQRPELERPAPRSPRPADRLPHRRVEGS